MKSSKREALEAIDEITDHKGSEIWDVVEHVREAIDHRNDLIRRWIDSRDPDRFSKLEMELLERESREATA